MPKPKPNQTNNHSPMFTGGTQQKTQNATHSPMNMGGGQTVYQQKLSKPVQQNSTPTLGTLFGGLYRIQQTNPAEASNLAASLSLTMNDPSSPYFQPYRQATSSAMRNLTALGADPASVTDDWYNQSSYLDSYLNYNGQTNTPSAPGKKATQEEVLAYQRYQYGMAMETTAAVDREWAAMQEELAYWTRRDDLNLSDDEIVGRVRANMAKKYPTLAKLDESLQPGGKLLELNHGTDYSRDAMYGAVWAARNDYTDGNIDYAMGMSAIGAGKTWQRKDDIAAKLDYNNEETYSPYSVSMTLDEAGAYFGVSSFEPDWASKHREYGESPDETTRKMYNQVVEAERRTAELEKELADMMAEIDELVGYYKYPEDVLDELMNKKSKYSGLFNLDETLKMSKDSLVKTTRAIDYRWQDIEKLVREKCALKNGKADSRKTLDNLKGAKTAKEITDEATSLAEQEESQILKNLAEAQNGIRWKGKKDLGVTGSEAVPKLVDENAVAEQAGDVETEDVPTREETADQFTRSEEERTAAMSPMDAEAEPEPETENAPEGTPVPDASGKSPMLSDDQIKSAYDKKLGIGASDANIVPAEAEATPKEALVAEATGKGPMLSDEQIKAAYDKKHGIGAYDADMAAAEAAEKPSDDPAAIQEQVNEQKLARAFYSLKGAIPERELSKYRAFPMPNGAKLAEAFWKAKNGTLIQGPVNTKLLTDENWVMTMAGRQAEKSEAAYMKTRMGSLRLVITHEDAVKERADLESQLNQMEQEYGDKILASQDMPDFVKHIVGNDETGLQLYFERGEDGAYHYAPPEGNEVYDMAVIQFMSEKDMTPEDFNQYVIETAKRLNDHAASIDEAKQKYPGFNEDMTGVEDEMKRLRNRISVLDEQIVGSLDDYNKAKEEIGKSESRRSRSISTALRNSGIIIDPRVSDNVTDFVSGFTYWQIPEEGTASVIDQLVERFNPSIVEGGEAIPEDRSVIRENLTDMQSMIDNVEFILENYGDAIPEDYQKQMNEYCGWLRDRMFQYNSFLLTEREDFDELAKQGRQQCIIDGGRNFEEDVGIRWMSSTEADIYYAMYASEGREAAMRFKQVIDGNLMARSKANVDMNIQELTDSGVGGRIFNEAGSIAMAGVEVPANIAYLITGNQWFRMPSYAAQKANESVIQKQKELYAGTIWGTVLPAITEMVNNRGRSMVVSGLYGIKGANEIVSAFPMAFIAMGEGVEKGREAGLEEWQCWVMGAVNFITESVSEGVKIGHYRGAFDSGLSIQSIKDFCFDRLRGLDWLSEAVGETANNIGQRVADKVVNGDEGEHEKRVRAYLDSGLVSNRAEAEKMVAGDYLKEDVHTAAISALSSFLDVGTFIAGKISSTLTYASEVQQLRRMGDAKTTISDLRNRDLHLIKSMSEMEERSRSENPLAPEQKAEVAENVEQELSAPTPEGEGPNAEYDSDQIALENAADSDQATKTATVAATLQTEEGGGDEALAAAKVIAEESDGNEIDAMQELLDGGRKAGIPNEILKIGIRYAKLADGMCRRVMNSDQFKSADSETQAKMLVDAGAADSNDQNVQQQIKDSVHESRVNEEAKRLLIETDAYDKLSDATDKAKEARVKAEDAHSQHETQSNVEQALAEAIIRASETLQSDPSHENADELNSVVKQHEKQTIVTDEYKQSAENADRVAEATEKELGQVQDEVVTEVYQQAEANVAEMEAAEAKAAEERRIKWAEEEQRKAEEQAKEDERTGKTKEEEENANIDRLVDSLSGTQEQKEKLRKQLKDRRTALKEGKADLEGRLTDSDSMLALGALQRKLGVPIVFSDDLGAADGEYDPNTGIIKLNARKAQDGSMRLGHALVQVALHEITHSLEQTKHYQKYKDTVLGILYGVGDDFDANAYEKDIRQIQDRYAKNGTELTPEGAEKEIIADFAKKRLSDSDAVHRFMDAGLGGKMRNMLHNINQALKNHFTKMTGEDRQVAENLRRAERQFQKMMAESTQTSVHPGAEQFSVPQFAQATGMTFDSKTKTLYNQQGKKVDGVEVKVSRKDIQQTPVGRLIEMGLSDDVCLDEKGNVRYEKNEDGTDRLDENGQKIPLTQKSAAHDLFAGLMNMVAMLKDENLVWEIAGSTLESSFSALKSNSDTQYHDTIDFGTICAKTQAIVNVMSRVMLDRLQANKQAIKEGRMDDVAYGLTREDVLAIYNETHKAGLSVPCPVCYVFSRWMGVPGLLGSMSKYQHQFVQGLEYTADGDLVLGENGFAKFDAEATQKEVDKYLERVHSKYKDKEEIDKRKQKLTSEIDKKEKKHTDLASEIEVLEGRLKTEKLTEKRREAMEKKLEAKRQELKQNAIDTTALDQELGEIESYNWVTQALCKEEKDADGNVHYVVDPDFQVTPDEVLMDMRRTGEFAERYSKNWAYRTSRGAGMGKSILPYSGASLGDILLGKQKRVATADNPLFDTGEKAGGKIKTTIEDARDRAKRQNLIGGQRLQSTSDFRPEWGLDYVMAFLELQAANSNAQMYTKVAEAIDLFATAGADVNLSIMGRGQGFHLATAEEIAQAEKDRARMEEIEAKLKDESLSDSERDALEEELEQASQLVSRMGLGKDDSGNDVMYVMDFSSTTGMDYDTAKRKTKGRKGYDNVQMILVGMNDTHIRLAMSNGDIDFIIPWHSSGNSKDVLSQLVAGVEETLETSSDYTSVQSDKFLSKKVRKFNEETGKWETKSVDARTDEQKTLWNARMKILTGIAEKDIDEAEPQKGGLTQAEYEAVKNNPYLLDLFERFYRRKGDKCYGVALTAAQAKQIFPYEYWQTDATKPGGTKETADENGRRFIEYCNALGVVPRFSGKYSKKTKSVTGNFAGAVFNGNGQITGYDPSKMDKGYWKLLIDRKMYGKDGKYREQKAINVTGINIGSVDEQGRISDDSMLPREASAKYGIPSLEQQAARASEGVISKPFNLEQSQKLYSDDSDLTDAELDDMLRQAGVDYSDAMQRGDTQAAQEAIETIRDIAGEDAATDTEYDAAVKRGDIDMASSIVKRAAKKAGAITDERGRLVRLYHGTRHFGFTKFDTGRTKFGTGALFTSSSESVANGYSEFGRTRAADSAYVDDDGTDATIIKNARNDLDLNVERLTEQRAEDIRQNHLKKLRELANLEDQAMEESPDYTPPAETESIFWEVVQAANDVLNEDPLLFDEDLEYREAYRANSHNWILTRNKVEAMDQLRDYFRSHPEEMERLKTEGSGYYKLLFSGYKHTDGVIDLEYGYKKLLESGDKFVQAGTDRISSRDELQERILSEADKGNYTLYGFAGDKPLEIDARNSFWTSIKAPMIGEGYFSTDDIVKWAKAHRYTSVIIRNVLDPGVVNEYGDDYIFFDSSQLKSADPVLHGDDGEVILPSQRFQKDNPDIRYSIPDADDMTDAELDEMLRQADAEYDGAVQRGDEAEAKKIVDRAAQEAGYTKALYHGTVGDFTVFNRGNEGIHLGTIEQATDAAKGKERRVEEYTKYSWDTMRRRLSELDKDSRKGIVNQTWWNTVRDHSDLFPDLKMFEGDLSDDAAIIEYVEKIHRVLEENGIKPEPFTLSTQGFTKSRIMELYAKINNPFVVEYDLTYWSPREIAKMLLERNGKHEEQQGLTMREAFETLGMDTSELPSDDFHKTSPVSLTEQQLETLERISHSKEPTEADWDAIAEIFEQLGYDGIQYMNAYEGDKKSYSYIALRQSDVKSADAITYDDNGQVIPPSQRFQQDNPDIRYSNPDETDLTDAELDDMLRQAGVTEGTETEANLPQPGELGYEQPKPIGPQRQWGTEMALDIDELSKQARDYVLYHSGYMKDTNQEQIERAVKWAKSLPINPGQKDRYQAVIDAVTSDSFDYRSADAQAKMALAMGFAVTRGSIDDQIKIADAVNKQGTELGRALQARKLFRLMTPEGRQSMLRSMLDQQQDILARKGIVLKDENGNERKLAFSEWVYRAAAAAQTAEEYEQVRLAAATELASQLPASWGDRLRSLRMLSMLANPRTHVRNFIGNMLFIPAVSLKNKMGALMELGLKQGERTKTLSILSSSEVREFARQDAKAHKDVLTGESKYDERSLIKQKQKKLGSVLDTLSEWNSNMLEREDWFFLKGHYRRALGGWMTANGYTVQQMKDNPSLLAKGREYAITEAQKATYRDYSATAKALNEVGKISKPLGFFVDAALPFKKTPVNILKRGVEYSPAGIAKGLLNLAFHMKQYTDYQEGKLKVLPDKAVSPSQVIDQICSGLSGTMITALGYLLAGSGAVFCGFDDDEDKIEKAKGAQKYSIMLFGHDITYTMDWAAPICMPFFVGAAVRNQVENEGGFDPDEALNSFASISEPVFNLSMLDGVNTLFTTSGQYGSEDTNTMTQIGAKVLTNYVTSYVPSFVGAIARIADDKIRKSYVKSGEGTGVKGVINYAIEQVENKIPGLRQQNIPQRNIWGEEKTDTFAERFFEAFISPGYIEPYKDDPILNEMGRLFDATGDVSMIPKEDPDKVITFDNERHVLEDYEWDKYKEARGKAAFSLLTELINSDEYKDPTLLDGERALMIKAACDRANEVGKSAVFSDYYVEDDEDFVSTAIADSKITYNKNEMMKGLASDDMDATSTSIQALRDLGVKDSEITKKISDKYQKKYKNKYKLYKKAVENDDDESAEKYLHEMEDIEILLDQTGFTFKFADWRKAVDSPN